MSAPAARMQARVVWQGAARFVGTADSGHDVAMDGPPEHGGRNQGARPMELMLLGVGGCTAFDIVDILRRGRQQVTGCTTEIEAERAATPPKAFTRIHFRFRIAGRKLSRAKVERAIALTATKYCSASILLERAGVVISHDYELVQV